MFVRFFDNYRLVGRVGDAKDAERSGANPLGLVL